MAKDVCEEEKDSGQLYKRRGSVYVFNLPMGQTLSLDS